MAVECIERYRQLNGINVLKVILKPTKVFPEGYFYCDASDEELVRQYTWFLKSQRQPYIIANCLGMQNLCFHQEKAFNIRSRYPDCINHINGIEYDNANVNLDVVTSQQNCWCKPSRGYGKDKRFRSFVPHIAVNSRQIWAKCVRTEVEAIQSVYQLEVDHEDYMYDFLKDRRKDTDILDLERTGKISEDEAIYHHVCRHALDNAWYYYRYNLADYFKDNHLKVPAYSIDSDGFMTHSITGQRLCPM